MAIDLNNLEEEVSTAESTADLSELIAQILVHVARRSSDIATNTGANGALDTAISTLGTAPILGLGNQANPIYVVADEKQPLWISVNAETTQIFANFAQIIHDFVDLKKDVEYLMKAVNQLQEVYGKHHHHISRIDANTGQPRPPFKPISFDP